MSIRPLDEQKCPLHGHSYVHSTNGRTEMFIRHSNVHSSIGQTEMSSGHSNVHSSNGRTEMSSGHSNVHWTSCRGIGHVCCNCSKNISN